MKGNYHRGIIITTALLAGLHLLLIGLGAFGKQLPQWLQPVVLGYTYPLFPQPWSATSSDFPTSDIQLEFRTCAAASWSDWQDAGAVLHYDNASVAERIEQSINEELRWQILNNLYSTGGRMQFDHITESSSYAKALYYVLRMHQCKHLDMPDTLQLRVSLRFTPEPNQAYTFQRSQLEFPKYTVPKP